MKQFWLMKSEPSDVSVDDVLRAPEQTIGWYGVRNYQARNFMQRSMHQGDGVFFYHSSCKEPGIIGIAQVASFAYPDPTQFDPDSKYFDPTATRETPRWAQVDVQVLKKINLITLAQLRLHVELEEMVILRKGNRLSITPVTKAQWDFIHAHLVT